MPFYRLFGGGGVQHDLLCLCLLTFDPSLAQNIQCNQAKQRSEANAISQNDPSCPFITVFDKNQGGGHIDSFDATRAWRHKQISSELYLKAAALGFSAERRGRNSWGSPSVNMLTKAWGRHYVTTTTRLWHLHQTAHAAHTSPPHWMAWSVHDRTC